MFREKSDFLKMANCNWITTKCPHQKNGIIEISQADFRNIYFYLMDDQSDLELPQGKDA